MFLIWSPKSHQSFSVSVQICFYVPCIDSDEIQCSSLVDHLMPMPHECPLFGHPRRVPSYRWGNIPSTPQSIWGRITLERFRGNTQSRPKCLFVCLSVWKDVISRQDNVPFSIISSLLWGVISSTCLRLLLSLSHLLVTQMVPHRKKVLFFVPAHSGLQGGMGPPYQNPNLSPQVSFSISIPFDYLFTTSSTKSLMFLFPRTKLFAAGSS